jgi:hypothetical protein
LCKKTLPHSHIRQRLDIFLYAEDDIATPTTIATVGAAAGNVFFPTKGYCPGATMA